MPRPIGHKFTCSTKIGDRTHCTNDAVALVKDDVITWFDPACDAHLFQVISERMELHPRAKISIRNAATWHVARDPEWVCTDRRKCYVHHPGSVIRDRSR